MSRPGVRAAATSPVARITMVTTALVLAACSPDDGSSRTTPAPVTTSTAATSTTTTAIATTAIAPTVSAPQATAAATTTGVPAATDATITSTPDAAVTPAGDGEVLTLGTSVQGRPVTAVRRGVPGGIDVLVVGVIHGDEDAGVAVVDELARLPLPDGVRLWLVPSMNPDGHVAGTRHNANGVDLNRNFPVNWAPLGAPGDWQYAGPAAASEPETTAMLALAELVRPDLTLWYHQDLFRINPAPGRDGAARRRYAELTGLPILEVSGGTYTGTASQWSRAIAADGGIGFTVELGPTLSATEARRHADAVLAVAAEL